MRFDWQRDFHQRGADDVRRQIYRSNFEDKKHRAAIRWLWWQDNKLKVIGIAVVAVVTIASAFIAKLP